MSHTHRRRQRPTAITAIATLGLLLACFGLAACGGSSSTTSTSTNASATVPRGAAGGGTSGPRGARFKALRECLQKNGVNLPQRAAGKREGRPGGPSGPRGFLGGAGGPQLPSGVSRAQFQAAIKKCGGGSGGGGAFAGRGTRLKSPAYLAALSEVRGLHALQWRQCADSQYVR